MARDVARNSKPKSPPAVASPSVASQAAAPQDFDSSIPTEAQADAELAREDAFIKSKYPNDTVDCQCAVGTTSGQGITVKVVRKTACQRVAEDYRQRYNGNVIVDCR